MTIGFIYWLLILLWLILGFDWSIPSQPGPWGFRPLGGHLLHFILMILLGVACFGWPIKG